MMTNDLKDSSQLLWEHGPFACRLIGNPDCPILQRWTFTTPWFKMRLHKFFPDTHDRDTHDHPWPFLTFVLKGGYRDIQVDGEVEDMRAGMVRWRSADHAHKTFAGPEGCWTFVVGPHESREWGFFPDGKWMPWRAYMAKFGHGMSCDD